MIMLSILDWLKTPEEQGGGSTEKDGPKYDTGRLYRAQLDREQAKEEHEDAMEVIEGLKEEVRKNNYAEMIEQALAKRRKDQG